MPIMFPKGGRESVLLPMIRQAGSYRLVMPRGLIRHTRDFPGGHDPDPTTDDRFFPVNSVQIIQDQPECALFDSYQFRIDDATSRCAFYVQQLYPGADPTPPTFEFQIRQSADFGSSVVRFTGTWTPKNWNDKGLLVQISGVLSNQWEFWARIPPDDPQPADFQLNLELILDRCGEINQAIRGPNVFGSISGPGV